MISLKQQIAYDMACDIAKDPEYHDPLPADMQQQLDADIQETLAKLQAFMAEDTIKAFAVVAVGQERTMAVFTAVGCAAARLGMVMVDKGTEVAAKVMEGKVEQVLADPRGLDLFLRARAEEELDEKESWNDQHLQPHAAQF